MSSAPVCRYQLRNQVKTFGAVSQRPTVETFCAKVAQTFWRD
jgi:hypothetical protein